MADLKIKNFTIEELSMIREKCKELEGMLNVIPEMTGNWLFEQQVGELLSNCRRMAYYIDESLKEIRE